MDNFPMRLKARMTEMGLTVAELSKRTKLSESNIYYYRNGTVEPRQSAIYKLSKALDVSEAWLIGWSVPMDRVAGGLNPELMKIIEVSKNLNSENQKKLLERSHELVQLQDYKKY